MSFKVFANPLTKGILWVKYEPDWSNGREYSDPDKDFWDNSAMILTLDLETWFLVTAHPLP